MHGAVKFPFSELVIIIYLIYTLKFLCLGCTNEWNDDKCNKQTSHCGSSKNYDWAKTVNANCQMTCVICGKYVTYACTYHAKINNITNFDRLLVRGFLIVSSI